ncbi:MAG: ATP-binding cassette domain-containing protein [Syntrophomonadaceae bacterium]|jgi:energy-coupling factor transport system ATP-binding protein|nr:ATP-binding cassette domain-containing protein [Syntrophomonadaceae bacterium]
MIEFSQVDFSYALEQPPLLKDVSFQIREGEFIAVLGRNASGKSTLARLFNGLLLPDRGNVKIDEMDTGNPEKLFAIRQKVGFLFPSPDRQLIADMVEDEVAFVLENLGLPASDIRERVDAALEMVAMENYRKHPPSLLSGGQKQKICIAGILSMRPKYMVLDEPTSRLDPAERIDILATLMKLKAEWGLTLIYITHHVEEIVAADRVFILQNCRADSFSLSELLEKQEYLLQLGIEPPEISRLIYLLNRDERFVIPYEVVSAADLVNFLCR